jgi:endoribonuclease Dicer
LTVTDELLTLPPYMIATSIAAMAHSDERLLLQHSPDVDILDNENDSTLKTPVLGYDDDIPCSDEDYDDENQNSRKPYKVSEKRKAQNIIFHNYVNENAKKIFQAVRKEELARANDEQLTIADLLAKDQTETIKDPREYQMELFDRAKKENIIAVLDTGSGKTLIAVLLLKHILDKELEDRAANLAPRVSFFLVSCLST